MEKRPTGQSEEGAGESSSGDSSSGGFASILEQIRAIAYDNARGDLDTEERLTLFLQSWWSRTYNRPLKDPILATYTLEELIYEFYDRVERKQAEKDRAEEETDKIEMDKEQADLDWAEKEEMKELAAEKAKEAPKPDPTKDPDNIKWMEEQIANAKKVHGETFGEDIVDNFEDS
jgi:hypothetical protein